MRLIEFTQFDTIYHEHFSYLSLFTVKRIFESAGLRVWNVEELPTHGGSLRIYGCHMDSSHEQLPAVEAILEEELGRGMQDLSIYLSFQARAEKIKNDLIVFLIKQKKLQKKVVAYGAAAKGNTLLNYAGIKPDLLPYVFDAAEAKQGKYMPGSHIPILSPNRSGDQNFDYMLILPWNIKAEVKLQNIWLLDRGVKFITSVPELSLV
jgi:hypothetical protein